MPPHSPSNPFLYLSLPCRSALCPEASRPSHCRLQHPKFLQQQQQLPLLSQPYLIPGNPQCRALHQLVSLMDGRACCLSHWPPAALPLLSAGSEPGRSRTDYLISRNLLLWLANSKMMMMLKPFHASEFFFIVCLSSLFLCSPPFFLPFAFWFFFLLLPGFAVFLLGGGTWKGGACLAFFNQGSSLGAAG